MRVTMIVVLAWLGMVAVVFGDGDTPIQGLKLIGPANGNQQKLTNLQEVAAQTTRTDTVVLGGVEKSAWPTNVEYASVAGYAAIAGSATNLVGPTSTVAGVLVTMDVRPAVSNASDLGTDEYPYRHVKLGGDSVYMRGNRVLGLDTNSGTTVIGTPSAWKTTTDIVSAPTTTISRVDGTYVRLVATNTVDLLTFDMASFPTNGFSVVSLDLFIASDSYSVTISTNTVTPASITALGALSKTNWVNLVFLKGYGQMQWEVR